MKKNLLILTVTVLLGATSCSYMHNDDYLQAAEEATEPNRNFLLASNASLPGRIYDNFRKGVQAVHQHRYCIL